MDRFRSNALNVIALLICVLSSFGVNAQSEGNRSESAFITADKEIFATLHSQVDDLISTES